MIKLTTKNGETIIIAPEHVRRIEPSGNHDNACYVDSIYVTESPEEVTRKILHHRLEIERYRAALRVGIETSPIADADAIIGGALKNLKELAGLEELK